MAPQPESAPSLGAERTVDANSLQGKMLMGYQGWFGCPGDGSELNRWWHWSPGVDPTPETATFDAWPDTSSLADHERCPTSLTLGSGGQAVLYSAYREATVHRHTEWMERHDIDGVFLQRFTSELQSPKHKAFRDQVAQNIRTGSEAHGRVFAIMYDISGHDAGTMSDDLKADWMYLVDTLALTQSDRYMHHGGRPVLGIWGLGFQDRPGEANEAVALMDWFHSGAEARYQATIMGGVPAHWRTLTGDSKTHPDWSEYYRSLDIISPWTVGQFADEVGADLFRTHQIEPDLATTRALGIEYMPVVFPGFSWTHLTDGEGPFNAIPRHGGRFYWRQVYNALASGSSMMYTAMFDEVDEGTAMFPIAATRDAAPVQGEWLTLEADGEHLPADWYLSVGGAATQMVRGDRPLSLRIPITPDYEPEESDSTPVHQSIVTEAYRGILGREPDPAGLDGYAQAMDSGMSALQLSEILWRSEEFALMRSGLNSEEMATELYAGILDRAPDPGGLEATAAAIEAGRGPNRAAAMLTSTEARSN